MTNTYNISGQSSFLGNLFRSLMVVVTLIGGFFILAASTAVAFFVLVALLVLGGFAFLFFWLKAKITGQPFGPRARYEKARADFKGDMESQFEQIKSATGADTSPSTGPVIDMHETPQGWSVDD